jgi:hypothetical protein
MLVMDSYYPPLRIWLIIEEGLRFGERKSTITSSTSYVDIGVQEEEEWEKQ